MICIASAKLLAASLISKVATYISSGKKVAVACCISQHSKKQEK